MQRPLRAAAPDPPPLIQLCCRVELSLIDPFEGSHTTCHVSWSFSLLATSNRADTMLDRSAMYMGETPRGVAMRTSVPRDVARLQLISQRSASSTVVDWTTRSDSSCLLAPFARPFTLAWRFESHASVCIHLEEP